MRLMQSQFHLSMILKYIKVIYISSNDQRKNCIENRATVFPQADKFMAHCNKICMIINIYKFLLEKVFTYKYLLVGRMMIVHELWKLVNLTPSIALEFPDTTFQRLDRIKKSITDVRTPIPERKEIRCPKLVWKNLYRWALSRIPVIIARNV